MSRILITAIGLMALLAPAAGAQQVLITGFPLGVGGDVAPQFFEPYHSQLQALADTLAAYPLARVVIVGTADGARYGTNNDAHNPGLSLGRAHVVRNLLVDKFGVDATQILIQSNDVAVRGDQYRSVSLRVDRDLADLQALMQAPAPEPPPVAVQPTVVEQTPVEVIESNSYFYDLMALRLSGGVTSSPFGALPMVAGAVIWKRAVAIEAVLGHTIWNDSYMFEGSNLSTWRRMIGGRVTVYPWQDRPVGITGGWLRVEEISQSYYEYVKLSEGPALGVEVTPLEYVAVTGLYNPVRHRLAGDDASKAKNGQFILAVTLFTSFGGGR